MLKCIKSVFWCILFTITYMGLRLLATKVIGEELLHFGPDNSDPKAWGGYLFVRQIGPSLMMVVPIVLSMLIYYFLYKFVFKERITENYGFAKAGVKNIFLGILIGFFTALLCLLILYNRVLNELIHKKQLSSLFEMFGSHGFMMIIRNTLLVNIILIITIGVISPFFEEVLFRGLVLNKLKTEMPIWAAIIAQALLFGILNMEVLFGVYAFILGLLFGILYIITKSIWVPALTHTILSIIIIPINELDKLRIFFAPLKSKPSEIIDTFVYKSLEGGAQNPGLVGIPVRLNIILGLLISLVIMSLIFWLWRSNKPQKN